jgi:hypothetical protein
MITGAVLLCALALLWVQFGRSRAAPLAGLELEYLLCSPLPLVLGFGVPAAVSQLGASNVTARLWSNRLIGVGVWLSGALTLVGIGLLWRRRVRGQLAEARLVAGVFLTAIPLLLALVVVLFYATRS